MKALKINDALYFAVLTGCLRVAKESIFTGLNNPKILSITTVRFDEYFGFTDGEVKDMLEYYGLEDRYSVIDVNAAEKSAAISLNSNLMNRLRTIEIFIFIPFGLGLCAVNGSSGMLGRSVDR